MTAVLARAVPVFREHGYDGASIDRLKQATGLTAGSLYKAFGDKRGLFAAAFARYLDDRRRGLGASLATADTGRGRIAETLRAYLASATGEEGRRGCLVVATLIEATTLDRAQHDTLDAALAAGRVTLATMIRDGQRDGSIRVDLAVDPAADMLLALLHGIRVVGKLRDPADHDAAIATALKILD